MKVVKKLNLFLQLIYTEVDIARMLLKKTAIQKIASADPVCVKVEGGTEYEGFPSTE